MPDSAHRLSAKDPNTVNSAIHSHPAKDHQSLSESKQHRNEITTLSTRFSSPPYGFGSDIGDTDDGGLQRPRLRVFAFLSRKPLHAVGALRGFRVAGQRVRSTDSCCAGIRIRILGLLLLLHEAVVAVLCAERRLRVCPMQCPTPAVPAIPVRPRAQINRRLCVVVLEFIHDHTQRRRHEQHRVHLAVESSLLAPSHQACDQEYEEDEAEEADGGEDARDGGRVVEESCVRGNVHGVRELDAVLPTSELGVLDALMNWVLVSVCVPTALLEVPSVADWVVAAELEVVSVAELEEAVMDVDEELELANELVARLALGDAEIVGRLEEGICEGTV
ncbi:hypothetical protein C8J57DRAFT_1245501 [Mycena rebaudengoi]|nr:hypothetical protein C8J57DRAFT_1248883 [Mycena rebaudengoi]KAJ7240293.1 hypothetical protein C8J57DRAFT_1245501 [Mycena rebaudengoi]